MPPQGYPLGLSHIQHPLGTEAFEPPLKEDRDYQSLAIEDKESV